MAEQWSAIYRTSNGELVSVGTSVADPLPAGLVALALVAEPNQTTERWNIATHAFEPRPVPTDDELLVAQPRRQRLTPTSAAGKAALRDFMDEAIGGAQAFDWFNTKIQADGSVAPAAKTTIGALNTAAYNRAKNAAVSWFQAP